MEAILLPRLSVGAAIDIICRVRLIERGSRDLRIILGNTSHVTEEVFYLKRFSMYPTTRQSTNYPRTSLQYTRAVTAEHQLLYPFTGVYFKAIFVRYHLKFARRRFVSSAPTQVRLSPAISFLPYRPPASSLVARALITITHVTQPL